MKAIQTVARGIIAERAGRPEQTIRAWHRLREDLDLTPLDLVQVLVTLEDHAKAHLPAEGLSSVETVGDLFAFLSSEVAQEEAETALARVA